MRALILSAGFGLGHQRAASALAAAVERGRGGRALVVDLMSCMKGWGRLAGAAFRPMIRFGPAAFDQLTAVADTDLGAGAARALVAKAVSDPVLTLVRRERPDVVFATHPFGAVGLGRLRERGLLPCLAIGVPTDFTAHALWATSGIDVFCGPGPACRDLLARGVGSGRVRSTGIPIDPAFAVSVIGGAPAGRGLPDGRPPRILLLGGGWGLGPLAAVARELETSPVPLEIVAVAGRNAPLRADLERLARDSRHRFRVEGFVDTRSLFRWADLLVGKPGGLSCAEALAAGLPMVLTGALARHELANAREMEAFGAAVYERTPALAARRAVSLLTGSPARLLGMQLRAAACGRPDAADRVVLAAREMLHLAEPATAAGW